jgi:pimeloyl-ACP methyl ester carboxylesterase
VNQVAPHRARSRRLSTPHGEIAVLDSAADAAGTRRGTALLVPGYTGSKEDFVPLLDRLAQRGFRVVTMDQPGQYESVGDDDAAAYLPDRLAQAVTAIARLIAEEDGDTDGAVHLLGHSFGGLVGRAAVIAEPQLFASLVLLASGPAAVEDTVRRERMEALEPVLQGGGMPAVHEAIVALDALDPDHVPDPPELAAFLRTRFLSSSAAGLKGMGDALRTEPDRVPELRATGVPVLVCYGEDDDAWTPATQAEMAERLGARCVVIPCAAHSPAIENTDATVDALVQFWTDVTPR